MFKYFIGSQSYKLVPIKMHFLHKIETDKRNWKKIRISQLENEPTTYFRALSYKIVLTNMTIRHFLYVRMDCQTHKCLIIKLSFWHVIGTHLINWNQKTDLKLVIWNKSYDRFSRRYRSKTVRAREPFDAKSVRAFAILCVRNVHMYVFGNTGNAQSIFPSCPICHSPKWLSHQS